MKKAEFKIVFITAPDMRTARKLARAALDTRCVACVSIVPQIESHYRWLGKIERSAEVLLVCKTVARRLSAFEKLVHRLHPYDTPEFVALDITSGSDRYLAWLGDCCKSGI